MKTKHTQGEWQIEGNGIFPKGKSNCIAIVKDISCVDSKLKPKQEMFANAKLIANAPKLLAGLQMIVNKRNDDGWDCECCALLAQQLIKEATE